MRRFLVFAGLGLSLVAAGGCSGESELPLLALVAARNAADTVRQLIARGYAADERDDRGWTPLMHAARANALDAMAVLLDAGADPNARDRRSQWTPLLHAVHKQQQAAVQLLLERGADPNIAAPGGVTPLMMAANAPDPSMVDHLLARGADPNKVGPGGRTALSQAVSGGALTDFIDRPLLGGCRPATVRTLLTHDPTLRLPDNFAGRQALVFARLHGCRDVLGLVNSRREATAQTRR